MLRKNISQEQSHLQRRLLLLTAFPLPGAGLKTKEKSCGSPACPACGVSCSSADEQRSDKLSPHKVLSTLAKSYPSLRFQRCLSFHRNERCYRAGAGSAIAAVGQWQGVTTAYRGTHRHSTTNQTRSVILTNFCSDTELGGEIKQETRSPQTRNQESSSHLQQLTTLIMTKLQP